MKLFPTIVAGGLVVAAMIAPATAQVSHSTTTVTKVHGPLKILPHHNRKICKTRWVNHHRTKKCWYH